MTGHDSSTKLRVPQEDNGDYFPCNNAQEFHFLDASTSFLSTCVRSPSFTSALPTLRQSSEWPKITTKTVLYITTYLFQHPKLNKVKHYHQEGSELPPPGISCILLEDTVLYQYIRTTETKSTEKKIESKKDIQFPQEKSTHSLCR